MSITDTFPRLYPRVLARRKANNPSIFVSYRRDDSKGFTLALYNALRANFGNDQVFMDVQDLDPGVDFVDTIRGCVQRCDSMIVVIGKEWVSASKDDVKRLDNPADYVRLEVSTALKHRIKVIPVLVDGAKMPEAKDLPKELRPLAHRNALSVDSAEFDSQVSQLLRTLSDIISRAGKGSSRHKRLIMGGIFAGVTLLGSTTYIFQEQLKYSLYQQLATRAETNEEYQHAAGYYLDALALASDDDKQAINTRLATVHETLGELSENKAFDDRKYFEQAEAHYRTALKYLENTSLTGEAQIASQRRQAGVLFKLAVVIDLQEKAGEALDAYDEQLRILARIPNDRDVEIKRARALRQKGAIYESQSRWRDAELVYTEAYGIFKRNFAGDHIEIAESSRQLGTVYRQLEDYDRAESYYNDSWEIYNKMNSSKELALISFSLGKMFDQLNDQTKAFEWMRKGATEYLKFRG